ncbi:MAG: sulfatase-like hydrolase/transferase [Pseudomonadota bacterium]
MTRILFITVDEQRYDALGANGGRYASTPNLDRLAEAGLNYSRAYVNNVVCMPSRATMLTGQYPSTHGLTQNGRDLPLDAPSFATHLKENGGFATALIGKSHLQPHVLDPSFGAPSENWETTAATRGDEGPYRGFDKVLLSSHGLGAIRNHYQAWLEAHHPEMVKLYMRQVGADGGLNLTPGGDTGGIQIHDNMIPTECYHSHWLADRTNEWIKERHADENWFCWLSFGDPHHPFQPPYQELGRVPWQEVDLPPGCPSDGDTLNRVLTSKPDHWRHYFEASNYPATEIPRGFVPADMTHDQIREINARVHVMNEVIDDAIGRVLAQLEALGQLEETHIFYCSDHGSMQGDVNMMFKGPFHVDSLMRVPLIWRPTASSGIAPQKIDDPVSMVDLAPTFSEIADVPATSAMQGDVLPVQNGVRDSVFVEWDQRSPDAHIVIDTIVTRDYICSVYGQSQYYPEGTGELYDWREDPHQWWNLWDDPKMQSIRQDLQSQLDTLKPPKTEPGPLCGYA